MKNPFRVLLPAFFVVLCAGILFVGCKKKETNPVSPTPATVATNTPVPTNTFTNTSTPLVDTNTPTETSTNTTPPTATETPTVPVDTPTETDTVPVDTPTETLTVAVDTPTETDTVPVETPTETDTVLVVDTPTETETSLVVDTPTETETPSCVGAYSSAYTFDSDNMCWQTTGQRVGTTLGWASTPVVSAPGAFQAHVDYDLAAQSFEEFYVSFTTPQNLAGKTLQISVRVDNEGAWWGGIQPETDGTAWEGTYYDTMSYLGTYATFTHTITDTAVTMIGVKVFMGAHGGAGINSSEVYIDDVLIFDPLTPTPTLSPTITDTPVPGTTDTPTMSPTVTATATATNCAVSPLIHSHTFDSTIECWRVDGASTPVVTALESSSELARTGAGALRASVTEGASSTSVQLELAFGTVADMTDQTIDCYVACDAALAGSQVQVFVGSNGYKWEAGGWNTLTNANQWYHVTFKPAWTGGGDSTLVEQYGVQFYNVPASAVGHFYVDDVKITGPPPPSCQVLFNSFEAIDENGTVSGENSTQSLTTSNATEGTNALDVQITTASGWNKILKLTAPITPNPLDDSGTYNRLMVDITVDAAVLNSGTGAYNQLALFRNDGTDEVSLCDSMPTIQAGVQTLTYEFNAHSVDTLQDLLFIFNNGGSVGGGLGHIYFDNIRLAYTTCP